MTRFRGITGRADGMRRADIEDGMGREHLRSLDSLRGICAIMVALMHLNVGSHFFAWPIVQNAWLFVDFFFVLSGFVIAYCYNDRLDSGEQVGQFVIRRFGRLWPLHATVLLIAVGLETARYLTERSGVIQALHPPFAGTHALDTIPANLLLLHALAPHAITSWNGVSWSISVEFFIYLIFAGLVWSTGRRLVPAASIALVLAGALVVFLLAPSYMQTETSAVVGGMTVGISNFALARCVYGFFLGVLTQRIWQGSRARPAPWLEFAVPVLVVVFVSMAGAGAASMAAPFVFALAVWVFAHERGLVSRLLRSPALSRIGAWSYSIYMVHGLVFVFITKRQAAVIFQRLTGHDVWRTVIIDGQAREITDLGSAWANDALALVAIAMVLALSALTYTTIERPGRAFFNRLASAWRRRALTEAPAAELAPEVYSSPSSSTSKISIALGGITPPAPRAP